MLPLDFFNRYVSDKNMRQQHELAPEIEKIKRRCKNNKQRENEEMQKLYKQKQINPIGSCLFMLVNLALTLTIFITLLNGLNAMSSYKIQDQYEQLQIAYVNEYVEEKYNLDIYKIIEENNAKADDDETKKSVYDIVSPYVNEITEQADVDIANASVKEKYQEVKDSFLWIDNIWIADVPYYSSIPDFGSYAGVARLTNEEKQNEEIKNVYTKIMDPLRESSGRANGFFILTLLTGGFAFLNQWLMTRKQRKQQKLAAQAGQPQVGSGKFMLIFMPVFMAFFSLLYTSMFSIYLVTSQIVSIATAPLMSLIIRKMGERREKKKKNNIPKNPRRV